MEHNPYALTIPVSQLPGVLPREVVEAALPLEYPEPYEAGLLVCVCPGIPHAGQPRVPHKLRLRLLDRDTVDVWCPHGCDPKMLHAAIIDLGTASKKVRK